MLLPFNSVRINFFPHLQEFICPGNSEIDEPNTARFFSNNTQERESPSGIVPSRDDDIVALNQSDDRAG